MSTENAVLMSKAKESLTGKWGVSIGAFLVVTILSGAFNGIAEDYPLSGLIALIISGPIALGMAIFSLNISRDYEIRFEHIFEGFRNFGAAVGTYLLMVLFILLWALLLIIPGIIAGISYAMAFYILADNEDIGPMEAIDKSKAMMYGYKWKYFRMSLRLFGLALLCILTLGIGFLWLIPYASVLNAKFYEDIKDNSIID